MTNAPTRNHEVLKLKELLFRQEQKTLAEVDRLVHDHHERIGTKDRMQRSVAEVLPNSLRDAQIKQHERLAAAISPVVISGIRREIRNSRDEMVDALYPITGRLVAAYVARFFRDFVEGLNDRLESGFSGRYLRLRIKSLFTGVPYSRLLLAETQKFQVEALLLIKRGSGILIDHWLAEPDYSEPFGNKDERLVSSLLAAITEFAQEALAQHQGELQMLDVGDAQIYLRTTPQHLVAIKCVGVRNRKLEKRLDGELLSILEHYSEALANVDTGPDPKAYRAVLPALAERLHRALTEEKKPPILALALLSLVALAGIGWFGHSYLVERRADQIRQKVEAIIAAENDLKGYPLRVEVARDAAAVSVSGLAPSPETGSRLIEGIKAAIQPRPLQADLAYVSPRDSLQQTRDSLRQTRDELAALEAKFSSLEEQLRRAATVQAVTQLSERIDGNQQAINKITIDLSQIKTSLSEVERQQLLSATSRELEKLRTQLQEVTNRLNDPRRKLDEWIRSHAIFFGDETAFRDPDQTQKLLQELRTLLLATNANLRVIGFTDPSGTVDRNTSLAFLRAQRVSDELVKLGVPRERIKLVGRPDGISLLSQDKGPNSSNRRVEFGLVYEGEAVEATGDPLVNQKTSEQRSIRRQ